MPTRYRTPMDVSTIHTAMARLVEETDPAERRRKAGAVASEIVAAFSRQGNQMQLALSDTEEVIFKKVDRLNEQQGDTNMLLGKVIEAIADMRSEITPALAEVGSRLKKLEKGQDAHASQINTFGEQLDDLRTEVRTYMAGSKRSQVDQLRAEVDALKRIIAAYDAAHPDEAERGNTG